MHARIISSITHFSKDREPPSVSSVTNIHIGSNAKHEPKASFHTPRTAPLVRNRDRKQPGCAEASVSTTLRNATVAPQRTDGGARARYIKNSASGRSFTLPELSCFDPTD